MKKNCSNWSLLQFNYFQTFRSDNYCSGLDKKGKGYCKPRRIAGQTCAENHHCYQSLCLTKRYAIAGFDKLVVT